MAVESTLAASREEAGARGEKRYFTGLPCKRGHMSERYTRTGWCCACVKAAHDKYRAKDPEAIRVRRRGYYAANPEKYAEWTRAFRAKNPAKHKAAMKRWAQANKGRVAMHARNRRAVLAGAEGTHTTAEVETLHRKQGGKCANCRVALKRKYHVDHIAPLHAGGRNDIQNIQILCQPCNNRKWAKDPIRFAQENGRLL